MSGFDLRETLIQVAAGRLSVEDAQRALERDPSEDLNLDGWRSQRTGLEEIVFGQSKTVEQIIQAVTGLSVCHAVLVTRLPAEFGQPLLEHFPTGCLWAQAGLFSLGRDLLLDITSATAADVIIITAGTTDLPVAREALGTARFFGLRVRLIVDVGVAGLHRLSPHLDALRQAKVIIAVAGMEGALPSVIGGLVRAPIIAVPTSTGYGANFAGLTPLLAMLNSCAPGVGVVNIDNGFGAAALAKKILDAHA